MTSAEHKTADMILEDLNLVNSRDYIKAAMERFAAKDRERVKEEALRIISEGFKKYKEQERQHGEEGLLQSYLTAKINNI